MRFQPLAVGLVFAIPTLLTFYPPMTDLANHEATVGILRHWGDASWFPPDLYSLNLIQTNQLFHLFGWILSFFTSTRWAMKLIVAAAQIAIFHAGGRFCDHLGKTRWATLLLAPLALGFTYYWGFVANLLGFAAFLYSLPVVDRLTEAPTRRRALEGCIAVIGCYFAHGSTFVALLPVIAGLALIRPLPLRARALAFSPALFGVAIGALGRWRAAALHLTGEPVFPTHFLSLHEKLVTNFATDVFGIDSSELLCAAALGFGALVVWRLAPPFALLRRPRLVDLRFAIAAVFFFIAYLAAPYTLDGAFFVHQRFLGPAWALFALALAPAAHAPKAIYVRIGCVVALLVMPVGILAMGKPEFEYADETERDLETLLLRIPQRSAVTFAALDTNVSRPTFEVALSGARVVALRGGRAVPSFTTSPISPVLVNPQFSWGDYGARLVVHGSSSMEPSTDLDYFGWVVVRAVHPVTRNVTIKAFLPDATLTDEVGNWMLFRSTHVLKGLRVGMPKAPRTETLLDRALEIENAARQGKL